MMDILQLSRAALKVALPLLAIGGALIAARRNGGDPRESLRRSDLAHFHRRSAPRCRATADVERRHTNPHARRVEYVRDLVIIVSFCISRRGVILAAALISAVAAGAQAEVSGTAARGAARVYREQHEGAILTEFAALLALPNLATDSARSEERRVGKEC